MRIIRCLLNDLRIQQRSGFWVVYGILCVLYLIILFALPQRYVSMAITIILFVDPCALGFYFIGGFAYLERDDGTLEALLVSPLDWREHLAGRVFSFAILALAAALIIAFPVSISRGLGVPGFLPLVLGVGLGAVFFSLVGLLPASRFKTVNDYIITAELWLIPFMPPLISYLGIIPDTIIWRFFPSDAVLRLLDMSFKQNGSGDLINGLAAVAVLAAWIVAAAIITGRAYRIALVEGGRAKR